MSIHESEVGLSFGDYTLLGAAKTNHDFQVVAHRYSLDFDTAFTASPSSTGRDWDMCQLGEIIYRLSGTTFQRLVVSGTGSGWQDVTGFSSPGSLTGVTPVSLVSDASGVHAFMSTTSGIQKAYWNQSSWSSWSTVTATVAEHLAAVTPERVHFLYRDTTNRLSELRVAEYDGSWADRQSDIWWGYPIDSFDAVALPDRDVLVMATDMPGMLTAKVINRAVVKSVLNAGGIMAFTYMYDTWSDHVMVEKLDEQTDWNRRQCVRLTKIDDTAWLTCLSLNGTRLSSFKRYRAFRTLNGEEWTRGELLAVTHVSEGGLQIVRSGGYAVAVERSRAHRAASTLLTGLSTVYTDISPYVVELKVARQDMAQAFVALDNKTGWVASSVVSGLSRCLLYVYGGAWVDSPKRRVMVLLGIFEVDTYGNPIQINDNLYRITGRDYTSWLSSATQSETFLQWEPQVLGGDDHTDTTGTSYGGLSHTAVMAGEWMTESGKLLLRSNDKTGSAMATFSTEMWNGDAQVAIQLTGGQSLEFAGLTFWMQDKDNYFAAYYAGNSQRIELVETRGGLQTFLTATTLGGLVWGTDRRFLRVEVYYSRIKVYSSEDNVNWTEQISYLAPGQVSGETRVRQGAFGYIGHGFSDRDNWSDAPPAATISGETIDIEESVNPTDEWCYEWDFTIDGTGGWVADDNANFVVGEGWTALDETEATFRIRRSADQAFYLKQIDITYFGLGFTDPFDECSGGPGCVAYTTLYANSAVIYQSIAGGFATTYTLPSPQLMSTLRTEWAFNAGGSSEWEPSGRVSKIRVYGVGYNPFGDNCS